MNLAGFKKLKEDKKMVTMGHPAGHSINILKSKLTAIQRKQLERMPVHKADGGDVEDPEQDSAPAAAAPEGAQEGTSPVENNLASVVNRVQNIPLVSPEEIKTIGASPEAAPQGGEFKTQAPAPEGDGPEQARGSVDVNQAYNQGQKGIAEQRDYAQELAKHLADTEQQNVDQRKELQANSAQAAQEFQTHQKQILNDYMNNHIDPKHFQESMGTGQKVATAIGLLLGGFTGGFSGTGQNPAADWLNGQITRDIDAQKSRLDQQKTLLGANQDLYHDSVLANNATRANLNDIYDHQLKLETEKLGTPAARAAYDMQHSKFALENSQLLNQNAVRAAALQAIRKGGGGLDPITLGQAGFMSPEEAKKEQASFDAQKSSVSRINNLYALANKEQTAGNLLNPQSYKRIAAINAGIRDAVLASDVNHRLSPEVLKNMIDPNLVSTSDNKASALLKQNLLLEKLQAHTAGDTPITSKYAPNALPRYALPKPQFQVGQIVYKNGQKAEVLANGKLRAVK